MKKSETAAAFASRHALLFASKKGRKLRPCRSGGKGRSVERKIVARRTRKHGDKAQGWCACLLSYRMYRQTRARCMEGRGGRGEGEASCFSHYESRGAAGTQGVQRHGLHEHPEDVEDAVAVAVAGPGESRCTAAGSPHGSPVALSLEEEE